MVVAILGEGDFFGEGPVSVLEINKREMIRVIHEELNSHCSPAQTAGPLKPSSESARSSSNECLAGL